MNIGIHITGDNVLFDRVKQLILEAGFQATDVSGNSVNSSKGSGAWNKTDSPSSGLKSPLLLTNMTNMPNMSYNPSYSSPSGTFVVQLRAGEAPTPLASSPDLTSGSQLNGYIIYYADMNELTAKLSAALQLIHTGVMAEQRQSLFYQAVTQYSHDGIICVDKDGIVTVFNQRASEVLGVAIDRAVGKPLVSFNPTAGLPRVLQQREIELEDIISVNGRRVAANRVPISIDGEIVGAISTFQDVTQLQKYEQMVRRKLSSGGFQARYTFQDIVAVAPSSRRVKETAEQCGKVDATVLITGESGTGKELFAQSMHNISPRARGPFVAVNCAALPESLLESELFGYDEGAFTGANRGGKQGLFELAHGGTLFLDEIGELPLSFQGRLLRVLQQREVLRVGGKAMIPVDVRVMAATHQPLRHLVQTGAFRSDLFYRLYVLSLHVPPLRERKEDIVPLAEAFLHELSNKYHKSHIQFTDRALAQLLKYDWPGNVRELHNVIERAVVMTSDGSSISEEAMAELWMMEHVANQGQDEELTSNQGGHSLTPNDLHLLQLYEKTHNVSLCAARLGMHRTTVWRHLKKLREYGYLHAESELL